MENKFLPPEDLDQQIKKAVKAGKKMRETQPVAVAARYDKRSQRIIVDLNSGISFMFPVAVAEGLTDAEPRDLKHIEISPSGQGLHWPDLDADLSIPDLLQGIFGTKIWMANVCSEMGKRSGPRTSKAKAAASRRNGALNGRSRKQGQK